MVYKQGLQSKVAKAVLTVLEKGYQVHPDALGVLQKVGDNIDVEGILMDILRVKTSAGQIDKVISKTDVEQLLGSFLHKENEDAKQVELDISSIYEVKFDPSEILRPDQEDISFRSLFRSRFYKLLSLASKRPEIKDIESLSGILSSNVEGRFVAGLVFEKRIKQNVVQLVLDDLTGKAQVIVLDDKLRDVAGEVLLDQMVLVKLRGRSRGVLIADDVFFPDIPDRVPSKADRKVYALLLSDLHVGSRTFLLESVMRLLKWLNEGDSDYVASRIRYLVIAGDSIDGVGVYPGQEGDLDIHSVEEQYLKVAELLEHVPKHIRIFVSPGNHDAVRQALPQPRISKKYAEPLFKLENVTMIGNPALINLHGVNVLVYHGRSLDDVIASTPGLTVSRPALAMKILLRARHLAPIYGGRTQLSPEVEDLLIIDEVPDILHSGHLHVIDSERYRGTLLVNSGTWQSQTGFQARMGIEPNPGIAPIVDLSTLDMLAKSFIE